MNNTLILLIVLAASAAAQQGFDFKLLDKLGANASNATNVTLDRSMLRLAGQFLGSGDDARSVRSLIENLNGIYVRSYTFDKPGQYSDADVATFRAFLAAPRWNRIVESRSAKDSSEVYVQPLPNDQLGGVAIISLTAKEVTVVYINGTLNPDDIGKLSGNMGIPKIRLPEAKKDK